MLLDACEVSELTQVSGIRREIHLGLVLMDAPLLSPALSVYVKTSRGTGSPVAPIWSPRNKAYNCTIIHEQLEKSLGVWITTSMS